LKELKREIAQVLAEECNVPLQTATCQRTGGAPAATLPPGSRATPEGTGPVTHLHITQHGRAHKQNKITEHVNKSYFVEKNMGSA